MSAQNPINALQAAMVAAAKADPTITALVGGRVYDEVPELDREKDRVVVGESVSVPDDTHDRFGRQVTVTWHVWTRQKGMKRGQDIAAALVALFHNRPRDLAVTGHEVVSIRCIFDQAVRDPDPAWRHHILRFRINTAQEA